MVRACIALKLADDISFDQDAVYIGADKGALILAQQKIPMRYAVGDFDSVSEQELSLIESFAEETIILPKEKDDIDAEAAMHLAEDLGCETILLYGAFGGRIDHSLMNLRLVYKNPGKVLAMDHKNLAFACTTGHYEIQKKDYRYISVFTEDEAVITLRNMKYPLEQRRITSSDTYTSSNEITGDTGILEVAEGKVLIIQSKD